MHLLSILRSTAATVRESAIVVDSLSYLDETDNLYTCLTQKGVWLYRADETLSTAGPSFVWGTRDGGTGLCAARFDAQAGKEPPAESRDCQFADIEKALNSE